MADNAKLVSIITPTKTLSGVLTPRPPTGSEKDIGLRRVISQPDDGYNFWVEFPTPLHNGNYHVVATQSGGGSAVGIIIPVTDRTGDKFRVITSGLLDTGDTIDFIVSPY